MPEDQPIAGVTERVRRLVAFMEGSDVERVRIEREDDEVEIERGSPAFVAVAAALAEAAAGDGMANELDAIRADLVGIFRLGRPAPVEGELLDTDRELAYVEALGIRNPVHSLGAGRIVTIVVADGTPVEYGQALFLVDRG
jgi:biotin carboxyl carrier protein